jgi:hypothetical protein
MSVVWAVVVHALRTQLVEDATSAAFDAVRKRDLGAVRQQVEGAMAGVSGDDAITTGAEGLAGLAAREAMVRVKRMVAMVFILGGLVVAALGAFLRRRFTFIKPADRMRADAI